MKNRSVDEALSPAVLPAFLSHPGALLCGLALIAAIALGFKCAGSAPDADEAAMEEASAGPASSAFLFPARAAKRPELSLPLASRKLPAAPVEAVQEAKP